MKKTLDKHEREIERSADGYRPLPKKKLRKIENILGRIRKSRNINIRISDMVLTELKKRSLEEGIPYQTLISSVLHKFVTNRLVDEKAIQRSIQILSSRRHKTAI
jgi:predicted DNA binding CopG/RHH family protein